jgi:hypothetical protein
LTTNTSTPLDLNSTGLRFIASGVEGKYQVWRNAQNLPIVRFAAASSVLTWLLTPLFGYLWKPDVDWLQVWRPGYVLVVPVLLANIAATYTRFKPLGTLLGAVSLFVASSCMLWTIAIRVPQVAGLETLEVAGPAIATSLLMGCFALGNSSSQRRRAH